MNLLRSQWDRAAAAVVIGLLALLIGWIGVSGTEYVSEQMSFIASGGLFGIFALGVGAALWISADLRDEWRKLDSVEQHLVEALQRFVPADTSGTSGDVGTGPVPVVPLEPATDVPTAPAPTVPVVRDLAPPAAPLVAGRAAAVARIRRLPRPTSVER